MGREWNTYVKARNIDPGLIAIGATTEIDDKSPQKENAGAPRQ